METFEDGLTIPGENNPGKITEPTLKKVGLSYLRAYYKNRNRADGKPTRLVLDYPLENGLQIDGLIEIPLADESGEFIVAFEATSIDKIGEVRYLLYRTLVFWDSMLFFSLTVFVLQLFWKPGIVDFLAQFGWAGVTITSLALFFLYFGIASKFGAFFSRYRQIFALEKFARFKANENWIILADDVPEALTKQEFTELKKQCIDKKAGLVLVDRQRFVNPILTPGRDLILSPAQILPIRNFKILHRLSEKWAKDFFQQFKKPFSTSGGSKKISESYGYFQKKILLFQAFFSVFFLILTSILFKQTYAELPVSYINEATYQKKMEESIHQSFSETTEYFPDSNALIPYKKAPKPGLRIQPKGE